MEVRKGFPFFMLLNKRLNFPRRRPRSINPCWPNTIRKFGSEQCKQLE